MAGKKIVSVIKKTFQKRKREESLSIKWRKTVKEESKEKTHSAG
jgi:hypothetical protein